MFVREEDMREHVHISSDIHQHIAWLQQDLDLVFTQLMLHHVNLQQERFIEDFEAKLVPELLK